MRHAIEAEVRATRLAASDRFQCDTCGGTAKTGRCVWCVARLAQLGRDPRNPEAHYDLSAQQTKP